mmetsp:Transcript_14739/g.21051  ORF Transcript_14739/g.21051 Transcript_14739/m.21051 type:complete len:100 (+) Transcript_14739:1546-1845(+)
MKAILEFITLFDLSAHMALLQVGKGFDFENEDIFDVDVDINWKDFATLLLPLLIIALNTTSIFGIKFLEKEYMVVVNCLLLRKFCALLSLIMVSFYFNL